MESPYTERLLVLIVASVQNVANQQAARVAPGAEHTFAVGLSPSGALPVTHYWCSWQMLSEQKASFTNYLEALVQSDRAWIYDGNTVLPAEVLAEHGLQPLKPVP